MVACINGCRPRAFWDICARIPLRPTPSRPSLIDQFEPSQVKFPAMVNGASTLPPIPNHAATSRARRALPPTNKPVRMFPSVLFWPTEPRTRAVIDRERALMSIRDWPWVSNCFSGAAVNDRSSGWSSNVPSPVTLSASPGATVRARSFRPNATGFCPARFP